MKRKKRYQLIAGATVLSMCVSLVNPVVYAEESKQDAKVSAGDIKLNPEVHYQTLKGWGTSLCWWGNIIGSWGDADYNNNGTPDREEIAELAFSPEYLNLNIVRYNVGGGDKEDTSIKRCEGIVPGWTEGMTGKKDGTGTFDAETFYNKNTEEMSDAGQIWMMEQANEYRKDEKDIINEVFSNSPPYYMTKSGTSTGGWNAENNLKEECYDDFATYMARATKWIDNNLEEKYGTGVTYVEPMNEPDTSYWAAGSTKQEGCTFAPGKAQSEMFRQMQTALDEEGLDNVQITGTDETALWNAHNSFHKLEDDVKENMTTIGAHTYGGNDSERKTLLHTAKSYDKDLWMSEVTKGGGAHWEGSHDSMDAVNAKSQSEGIMADLKYMQPTAWIAWLVADSEYECLQTNSNWGLLHAVFEKDGQPVPDYHTNLVDENGNRKDGVPGEGYWAVTKQFYTMMQYSKYLKAGYTMIDISDGNMCAAVSPNGDEIVIVAQNFGNDRTTTVDLSALNEAATAEVYQTSDAKSCEKVETQDIKDGVLDITLPRNSVTTYVIQAEDGSAMCSMENYANIVGADVVKPEEDWTSDRNKFTYEGSWGESADEFGGGKYTTSAGTSVTFTFEGEQAAIYGTKGSEAGKVLVSVDGGEAKEVDLSGNGKDGDAIIYYTGKLENAKHTVMISKAEGHEEKLLEINHAKVIYGEFIEQAEGVESSGTVFTVSGVKPILPDKVKVVSNQGNITEKAVVWDVEGQDFTSDVKLTGSVEGTDEKGTVDVKIVPEHMAYYIDCNSPKSPAYASVDAYADLLNEVPDQPYEKDAWGYVETYGAHDTDESNLKDAYETGWWAKEGQSIQYTIPLEKGSYKVEFGFKEWWKDYNSSRQMKVSMVQGETKTELGTTNTWNGGNWWNDAEYEITCETAGDVTFEIAKNGDLDPVLSFIKIQKVLDTEALKAVLAQAAQIDRSQYSAKKLKVLDQTVEEGHPLLYKAEATQKLIEEATDKIQIALDALEAEEVDKTSLNHAILMAEKMEKEQEENKCYTAESWEKVADALKIAREVAANQEADQKAVDEAFLNLITACSSLENAAQKVGLKAAIEGAEAILADTENLSKYTEESVEAVRTALAEAKAVFNNEVVEQGAINAATTKLLTAVNSMLMKEEDTRLDILIEMAETLLKNKDQYTSSSVEALENALEAAKEVANKENATEAEVNKAYNDLAEAMTSLVRKANKAELKNALDKANEILNNKDNYTESSIAGLEEAKKAAQTVYDKEDATQDEVGEALKKLITEILEVRILGDVNQDAKVDSADVEMLLRYNAELEELSGEQLEAADVNQDKEAYTNDARMILQYVAEMITKF